MSNIPLTNIEVAQYLHGYRNFPGAVETEHGVEAPAQAVVQAVIFEALRSMAPGDALDITAADLAGSILSRLNGGS